MDVLGRSIKGHPLWCVFFVDDIVRGSTRREEVERWRGGEVERWRGGEVERWRGGEVERWRGGEVERWRGGEVERWRGGEVERWRGGEVERWRGGEEDSGMEKGNGRQRNEDKEKANRGVVDNKT